MSDQPKYLIQQSSGHVYVYDADLAKRPDFKPLNAKYIPPQRPKKKDKDFYAYILEMDRDRLIEAIVERGDIDLASGEKEPEYLPVNEPKTIRQSVAKFIGVE